MIHKFDLWLYTVDEYLIQYCGLDSGSLEDWLWHDAYDSGMLPKDAARTFLEEQGFFSPALPNCAPKGDNLA